MKKLLLNISLFFTATTFSQTVLPVPDHIVIVILENHGYSQIIGSSAAPHINALAVDPNSALFTKSYGIEHPSQPNYLDLYSGCNQGVTNDNVPAGIPFTTANLGKQLINAGKTFITYSEDLPSVGYNGASSGNYARKHNPAANWMGTGTNQIPATTNQPFSAFPSTNFALLPTVCYVVPNQNHDMHNGSDPAAITTADTWVYTNLFSYIQWAKTHNSLFILTFDEDNDLLGNHIVTIFTGQMVVAGQYTETINHYSVLRTIEDIYGLPFACNASTAHTISDCWNVASGIVSYFRGKNLFSVYSDPVNHNVTLEISGNILPNNLKLSFINILGKKMKEVTINSFVTNIEVDELTPGIYLYQLKEGADVLKTGKIILE